MNKMMFMTNKLNILAKFCFLIYKFFKFNLKFLKLFLQKNYYFLKTKIYKNE